MTSPAFPCRLLLLPVLRPPFASHHPAAAGGAASFSLCHRPVTSIARCPRPSSGHPHHHRRHHHHRHTPEEFVPPHGVCHHLPAIRFTAAAGLSPRPAKPEVLRPRRRQQSSPLSRGSHQQASSPSPGLRAASREKQYRDQKPKVLIPAESGLSSKAGPGESTSGKHWAKAVPGKTSKSSLSPPSRRKQ